MLTCALEVLSFHLQKSLGMTVMVIFLLSCKLQVSDLNLYFTCFIERVAVTSYSSFTFPLAMLGVLFLYLIATTILLLKNSKYSLGLYI